MRILPVLILLFGFAPLQLCAAVDTVVVLRSGVKTQLKPKDAALFDADAELLRALAAHAAAAGQTPARILKLGVRDFNDLAKQVVGRIPPDSRVVLLVIQGHGNVDLFAPTKGSRFDGQRFGRPLGELLSGARELWSDDLLVYFDGCRLGSGTASFVRRTADSLAAGGYDLPPQLSLMGYLDVSYAEQIALTKPERTLIVNPGGIPEVKGRLEGTWAYYKKLHLAQAPLLAGMLGGALLTSPNWKLSAVGLGTVAFFLTSWRVRTRGFQDYETLQKVILEQAIGPLRARVVRVPDGEYFALAPTVLAGHLRGGNLEATRCVEELALHAGLPTIEK